MDCGRVIIIKERNKEILIDWKQTRLELQRTTSRNQSDAKEMHPLTDGCLLRGNRIRISYDSVASSDRDAIKQKKTLNAGSFRVLFDGTVQFGSVPVPD